jgi:hypothetical protein
MRLVAKLVGEVDLPVGPVAALDAAIDVTDRRSTA